MTTVFLNRVVVQPGVITSIIEDEFKGRPLYRCIGSDLKGITREFCGNTYSNAVKEFFRFCGPSLSELNDNKSVEMFHGA